MCKRRVPTPSDDTLAFKRFSEALQAFSASRGRKKAGLPDKVIDLARGPTAPTLDIVVAEDQGDGWNLQILTTNFRFAPDHVNQPHQAGEGHARLYINGENVARVYGPWFHIGSLPSGRTEVTVILISNDHHGLTVGDEKLSVTKEIHVH